MKINRNLFKKDYIDSFKNFETLYSLVAIPFATITMFFFITKKQADAFSHFGGKISTEALNDIMTGFDLLKYPAMTGFYFLQWNTAYFFIIALIVMVLPFVISSTAFTSEKEQGTIELLFHAPISDADLLFTKMVVSILPSLLLAVFCYAFMLISSYFHSGIEAFKYMMQLKWLLLHFVLVPLYAFISTCIGLSISIVKKNSRAAMLTSMVFFLPLMGVVIPLIFGTWLFTLRLALYGVLLSIPLLWLVFRIALKLFDREKIILSYY